MKTLNNVKRLYEQASRAWVVVAVLVLLGTIGFILLVHFKEAKYAAGLMMSILYLFHLAVSAACGFTILQLWAYRDNPLIKRMAIYMHAAPINALTAIILLFMSSGVKLTWKFSITLFAGTLLADVVRIPFIMYTNRRAVVAAEAPQADK